MSALWSALRVYAVGAAVLAAQFLRRCRGRFVEPGGVGGARGCWVLGPRCWGLSAPLYAPPRSPAPSWPSGIPRCSRHRGGSDSRAPVVLGPEVSAPRTLEVLPRGPSTSCLGRRDVEPREVQSGVCTGEKKFKEFRGPEHQVQHPTGRIPRQRTGGGRADAEHPDKHPKTSHVLPQLPGLVAIVTGGTDGIGFATAKHLAQLGMHVIIAGNNAEKAPDVIRRIREETRNDQVEFLFCDLSSMRSIWDFVHKFKAKKIPLHVLVNNAGVMMVPQRKTQDGFEEHFGLNYLGHFLLTNLLLDTLRESGSTQHRSRVITVSSATHYIGRLNMDDLQGRRGYSPHGAYAQSKLALVLFSHRLQLLLGMRGDPVTATAVDPGVVDTELYRHVCWATRLAKRLLGWVLFKTPAEGAWTSVMAAVAPELEGLGGQYLYNERPTRSLALSYDTELQHRLWTRSCDMTGIPDVTRHHLPSMPSLD